MKGSTALFVLAGITILFEVFDEPLRMANHICLAIFLTGMFICKTIESK